MVTGTVILGAEVAEDTASRLVGCNSSSSSRLRFRELPIAGCGGRLYGSPFRGIYQLGCEWGRNESVPGGDGNLEDGDCDCIRGGDIWSIGADSVGNIDAWLKYSPNKPSLVCHRAHAASEENRS
jgi:hypothetical protein